MSGHGWDDTCEICRLYGADKDLDGISRCPDCPFRPKENEDERTKD